MRIGIGLPNPFPGTPGTLLPTWASQAEQHGFSTLATIDRVAFANHDSLIALAAAAAVTERIELLTNILLLPTRQPALLAKETATIASISNGRLTLGIGVGGREDDFTLSETSFADRGKRTDQMLETMTAAWRGEPIDGSTEPVVPVAPGHPVPRAPPARCCRRSPRHATPRSSSRASDQCAFRGRRTRSRRG